MRKVERGIARLVMGCALIDLSADRNEAREARALDDEAMIAYYELEDGKDDKSKDRTAATEQGKGAEAIKMRQVTDCTFPASSTLVRKCTLLPKSLRKSIPVGRVIRATSIAISGERLQNSSAIKRDDMLCHVTVTKCLRKSNCV